MARVRHLGLSSGGLWALLLLPGLAVAAPAVDGVPYAKDARGLVIADIKRGEQLFQQNCARCHGERAEGAADWRKRGPDGKYPPPPLNGTAHAWHHPREALARTIRQGTKKIGGNMPPFGDKLAEDEIQAIITWLVSRWPDQIYKVWSKGSGRR